MKFTIGAVGSASTHAKNNLAIVYVNSFEGDNYHSFDVEDKEQSELDSRLDKIKHINKDPETYLNSLMLYNEYMETLVDKYGGDKLYRIAFKSGMITEKIPPKPEFKVTKKNRDVWNIINNGGAISKVNDLSMSEEQEQDYLERAGLLDCADEVTLEAGEHPKYLSKTIKSEKPKMGIDYDEYEDYDSPNKKLKYTDAKSLDNYLSMTFSNMEPDGWIDFEPTLKDVWENTPRLQEKERREAEAETKTVNVHMKSSWRQCRSSDVDVITSFENSGWDTEKLKDVLSDDLVNRVTKDRKIGKKREKKKKKRDQKFEDFQIKRQKYNDEDNEDHANDIFKEFASFTDAYFNFSSENMYIK